MAETPIEWADAVWNPTTGCAKVSPGCKHCYAEKMHKRLTGMGSPKYAKPFDVITTHEDALMLPLKWKKPQVIFVNSMSDLFHEDVPDEFIYSVFAAMALCRHHEFLVLTKRAERMADLSLKLRAMMGVDALLDSPIAAATRRISAAAGHPLPGNAPLVWWSEPGFPPANVRLGVSIEDQQRADERLPHLMELAAAGWNTMISAEPLLGPVDLRPWLPRNDYCAAHDYGDPGYPPSECADCGTIPGLDWVIVGGESGPGARPMHPDHARSIRDQCAAAGTPYFHKQNGEWLRLKEARDVLGADHPMLSDGQRRKGGRALMQVVDNTTFVRVTKKRAGRLLDGVIHGGRPECQR